MYYIIIKNFLIYCTYVYKPTTVTAVKIPNIGTLAFANAKLAAIIAAPKDDPPFSNTNA